MGNNTTNKPGLTVIVGAGASVPIGLPSTAALTETVTHQLLTHKTHDHPDFALRLRPLLCAVSSYYGKIYNFEHLWDALEAAKALAIGWKQGNAPTTSEAALTIARPGLELSLDYELLTEALFALKRTLLTEVTNASAAASSHPDWGRFQEFWLALSDAFSLTVVTLNYDTLLEQALALNGAHQGMLPVSGENIWRLDPSSVHNRGRDHRLFHLHGSIHLGGREYGVEPNRFAYEDAFHELYWHPTTAAAQQTMWGKSSPRSQSGRHLEGDRIITGLNKTDKLLIEPLMSYQVEAVNQLTREPRLLVVGYGFSDFHVNAALQRMTRIHGDRTRTCVIDLIDMVQEIGSTRRANLMVMLQRWGRTRFEFHDAHPDPWLSANGFTRLQWRGLLETNCGDLIKYFAG